MHDEQMGYNEYDQWCLRNVCWSLKPNFVKSAYMFLTTVSRHLHTIVSLSMKVPYFSLQVFPMGSAQSFLHKSVNTIARSGDMLVPVWDNKSLKTHLIVFTDPPPFFSPIIPFTCSVEDDQDH